jgi:hypothetical protein
MKIFCSVLVLFIVVVVVNLVFVIEGAQAAFTQADLAGNWYASVLSTGSGEVAEKADMVIDSLGNFTYTWVESEGDSGTDNGNLILSSKGKITDSTDTSLQGAMNISNDIFVFTLAWEPGTYALHIFSRVGSGVIISDLQGTWYDFSLTTGGNEYWETGITTFDNEGNNSHVWNTSLGDSGTGTTTNINVSSNGIATSPDDQAIDFSRKVLSISSNLVFGVDIWQPEYVLSAHLKSGASYLLADMEGTWYGYGITSGTSEYIGNDILTVNAQGDWSSFSTSSSGESATMTGKFSLSNIGVISETTKPTLQGFLSSDKDFAVVIETRGAGEYALTTLFKEDTSTGDTGGSGDPLNLDNSDEFLSLTDSSSKTLTSGLVTYVYGCSGINNITLEKGSGAKLFNMPGSNTITIEAASSIFTVSRSGAYVTFEGTDGTILKMPATIDSQTIVFNDRSLQLIITSGNVMLENQIISLTTSAIN